MKRLLLAGLLAVVSVAGASAQDYPNRPITVIVPFPAGGPTDAIIRNLGERMRVSLGQPLIVEYVTGAGGTVGTTRANRAAPDGYTIICGHFGTHATNGAVYQLPYDLVTDFTPISLLPRNPYLVVAQKNLPPNNLREFMAYLKANPGKVNMGHPGVGTGPHLLRHSTGEPRRRHDELRSLSRLRSGDDRSDRRPDRSHGRSGADLVGTNSRRHDQGLCDRGADARELGARCADGGRGRRAGAAHVAVVRLLGAARHAGTDRQQAQSRGAGRARRCRGAGAADEPRAWRSRRASSRRAEALVAQQKADIAIWWPIIKAAGIKQQ